MSERNLDFDTVIDRRGTKCLKYDFAVQRHRPADVLPLWVADMDFKISSYIEDALIRQAQHAIYGYTESDDAYFAAVQQWMAAHHGWQVQPAWLQKTPGVVFAIAVAVKACTQPGDAVLIQQPVYYPFSEVIADNGRRLVSSDLVLDEATGHYEIDFTDFERIGDYAKEAVKSLAGAKIISGMEDGSFAPMESATRAQTAKMVYELMKIINAEV